MSKLDPESPEQGGDFPEIDLPIEGSLEEQILKVVIDALNNQGYPGLSPDSLRNDALHRSAAIDMLKDCRPLPVILSMIDKIESGHL